jgi:hypothetical protein
MKICREVQENKKKTLMLKLTADDNDHGDGGDDKDYDDNEDDYDDDDFD